MTHHLARMAAAVLAGIAVEVRPADPRREDLDDHLARSRPGIGSVLDRDVVVTPQYQRPHAGSFRPPCASMAITRSLFTTSPSPVRSVDSGPRAGSLVINLTRSQYLAIWSGSRGLQAGVDWPS